MKKINFDLEKELAIIADMTENNLHIERLIYIAKLFNYSRFIAIFEGFKAIEDNSKGITQELFKARYDYNKEMMDIIASEYGNIIADEIKMN